MINNKKERKDSIMETTENTEKRSRYISVPGVSIGRFILFLGSIALAYECFKLIFVFWKALELGGLSEKQQYSINQLVILPWFFIEYCILGLSAVCFVAWIKKGFSNLKSWKEDTGGLISGLIGGLIVGLISGLISGPIEEFKV